MEKSISIGLDIGTTTISAVVLDTFSGSLLARRTVKSEADLSAADPREKIQDAALIEKKTVALLEALLLQFPKTGSIGITGQMHGVVYLDGQGNLCSPLYTWQDQQAAPYCEELKKRTGHTVAPGYGLATHYALQQNGRIPAGAAKLCTIMDYLAFALTGNLKLHCTNAAGLGFYSGDGFDKTALQSLGIDTKILPEVTENGVILGKYRGIPVAVAIGDNQASFLGSVSMPGTMALANFGTGSQISLMTKNISGLSGDGEVELRPYVGGAWLASGSALCGGRAYALLERFFRSFACAAGMDDREGYDVLNQLAWEGLGQDDLPAVNTTFCGTRAQPQQRGSIQNLTEENFTPAAVTAGLLLGMARELKGMFDRMPAQNVTALVASGNGVRRNTALVQALERVFGLKIKIPVHQEEAAFGAALFAAAEAENRPLEDLQRRCIHYNT